MALVPVPAGESTQADQLRRIEAVTDTALAHLDIEEFLLELLTRVRGLLGVDTAAVLLVPGSPGSLNWHLPDFRAGRCLS